jgi:hypothetical protein
VEKNGWDWMKGSFGFTCVSMNSRFFMVIHNLITTKVLLRILLKMISEKSKITL